MGFWIIAQAPQLLENYRLQSCDGLALPFLINWLTGDITNLAGCMLTNQRQFQVLIAAYFCFVDFCLTGQYAWYTHKTVQARRKSKELRHQRSLSRSRSHVSQYRSLLDLGGDHHNIVDVDAEQRERDHLRREIPAITDLPTVIASDSDLPSDVESSSSSSFSDNTPIPVSPVQYLPGLPLTSSHDHLVSNAMIDIADAVSGVVRSVTRSRSRRGGMNEGSAAGSSGGGSGRGMKRPSSSRMTTASSSQRGVAVDYDNNNANNYDGTMRDSFYSDVSGREASTTGNSPVSTTGTMHLPLTIGGQTQDNRGRPTHRHPRPAIPLEEVDEVDSAEVGGGAGESGITLRPGAVIDQESSSTAQKKKETKKKTAGVLLFGVWMIFGVGQMGGLSIGRRNGEGGGAVERRGGGLVIESSGWETWSMSQSQESHWPQLETGMKTVTISTTSTSVETNIAITNHQDSPLPSSSKSRYQLLIGRISAWISATLYLTSRLPQIWKNWSRKSCEGLSVLLFLFAFMGNITYVASILINPAGDGGRPEDAANNLWEALP